MSKAFFEKITHAGKSISTKDSVIKNVECILNSGGLLDAGVDGHHRLSITGDSEADYKLHGIYRSGLPSVADQSLDNQQQLMSFQRAIANMLKTFEPRIKNINVINTDVVNQRSRCRLQIELAYEKFEREFVFD